MIEAPNIPVATALILFLPALSSWGEEIQIKEDVGQTISAPSSTVPKKVDEEKAEHRYVGWVRRVFLRHNPTDTKECSGLLGYAKSR